MKHAGLLILLLVVAVLAVSCVGSYNGIVSKQEAVESSAADIGTQLQRRADLIPNLVNTVKSYMEHETAIIDSITASREKLVNAGTMAEKAAASDELTAALQNFNLVVENYPDLKANTNFIQLQDELAGSENRISAARQAYNAAVKLYNEAIKKIPGRFIANWFGFDAAGYFEAAPGSEVVPNVSF